MCTWQLNWRVKWYHLKDTFAEAGEVLYANVASFSDGRSKGFGVVEFANAEDAESAIGAVPVHETQFARGMPASSLRLCLCETEMFNGKEMDGRPVIVRHDRKSAAAPSAHRVFVGNLAYSVTWADLKDHFRAVGDVRHAPVFRTDDDRSKVHETAARVCHLSALPAPTPLTSLSCCAVGRAAAWWSSRRRKRPRTPWLASMTRTSTGA